MPGIESWYEVSDLLTSACIFSDVGVWRRLLEERDKLEKADVM